MTDKSLERVRIFSGYRPGSLGKITELHATYYNRHWDFGLFFERKVASELAEFLGRLDESTDGIWLAFSEETVIGSIALDGARAADSGAHLRWYIVDPDYRNRGIGRNLLETALNFSDCHGHKRCFLWTFQGLEAARHLYESTGFKLRIEKQHTQWGRSVLEQKFERIVLG